MSRYTGKVAFVTGAGGGIGRAIAIRLAAEGAAVAIAERDAARGEAVAVEIARAGGRAQVIPTDVGIDAELEGAVTAAERALGPLDVVVSNVAMTARGTVAASTVADFDAEVALTLRAPFVLAKATLERMAARGRGVWVAIGSVNGRFALGNPAYSAAKAGLLNLVRSMALEYGPMGLRAVMVSPGTVRTDNPSWTERLKRDPEVFAKLARWYPVRRVGTPEDIAAAVAYMASDEASFVNGAELVVDGGFSVGNSAFIEAASGED